jgi:hypothetical protein
MQDRDSSPAVAMGSERGQQSRMERTTQGNRNQTGGRIPRLQIQKTANHNFLTQTSIYILSCHLLPRNPQDTQEDSGPPKIYGMETQVILPYLVRKE